MTEEVTIDTDIPYSVTRYKYPLNHLAVWDSFRVSVELEKTITVLASQCAKKYGKKFVTRKDADGIRVWRVPLDYKPKYSDRCAKWDHPIERDIPIPGIRARHRYGVGDLEVGDTTIVEGDVTNVRASMAAIAKAMGWKIKTKTVARDTLRIWRVK